MDQKRNASWIVKNSSEEAEVETDRAQQAWDKSRTKAISPAARLKNQQNDIARDRPRQTMKKENDAATSQHVEKPRIQKTDDQRFAEEEESDSAEEADLDRKQFGESASVWHETSRLKTKKNTIQEDEAESNGNENRWKANHHAEQDRHMMWLSKREEPWSAQFDKNWSVELHETLHDHRMMNNFAKQQIRDWTQHIKQHKKKNRTWTDWMTNLKSSKRSKVETDKKNKKQQWKSVAGSKEIRNKKTLASNPYNAFGGVRQSHAINIGNPII